MKQETAETIALQVLTFLVSEEDLRDVFIGSTGTSAEDARARAAEADFLISVLDFLMMDDAWVQGFCDAAGLPYDQPMQARMALPGGGEMHWT